MQRAGRFFVKNKLTQISKRREFRLVTIVDVSIWICRLFDCIFENLHKNFLNYEIKFSNLYCYVYVISTEKLPVCFLFHMEWFNYNPFRTNCWLIQRSVHEKYEWYCTNQKESSAVKIWYTAFSKIGLSDKWFVVFTNQQLCYKPSPVVFSGLMKSKEKQFKFQ